MSPTPLHPALVHLPLGLALVAPLVAGALVWALWRDRLPRWAWTLLVGLQALMVAGAVVSLRSGESDEERVERVVAERLIEAHEHAAQGFTAAAVVVLLLAVGVLFLRSGAARRGLSLATVAGTLAVAGLGLRAGHAGGELVYVHGAGAAYAAAPVRGASAGRPAEGRAAARPVDAPAAGEEGDDDDD